MYTNIIIAANVKRSGSMANGPRPNAWNPKIGGSNGLEVKAWRSRTVENIINAIVNSDLIF